MPSSGSSKKTKFIVVFILFLISGCVSRDHQATVPDSNEGVYIILKKDNGATLPASKTFEVLYCNRFNCRVVETYP